MKTLYLSGPITNNPNAEELFAKNEAHYTAEGYRVINPLKINPRQVLWHQAMRRDLAALVQADAIVMLPGWEYSEGARLEHLVAQKLNIPVIYQIPPSKSTIEKLLSAIEQHLNVTFDLLRSPRREAHIVDARRIFAYALKTYAGFSTVHISRLIHRNHATVVHLIKTFNHLMQVDKKFAFKAGEVLKSIEN